MTHFLDERTLQRCVDGELSEAEQQALLLQLDRSPEGWRKVALAFIEHQLWSQAGRDFVHEPPLPLAAPADPEPETRRDHSWLRHTMLAACTLIAVGLGYLGGTQRDWLGGFSSASTSPPMDNSTAAVEQTHPVNITKPVPTRPARRGLAPVMQVQVLPSGENGQPIMLPVYDADELLRHGPLDQPLLSAEVLQNLRDQGVQIEQESHLYQMPNSQNRKLVVPVNTIQFHQPLQ